MYIHKLFADQNLLMVDKNVTSVLHKLNDGRNHSQLMEAEYFVFGTFSELIQIVLPGLLDTLLIM